MLRRIGNTSIGRSVLLKYLGASPNLSHQPGSSLRCISTVAKRAAPASLPAVDITLAARPKKVAKRPAARKAPVLVEVPLQDPAIPDASQLATNVAVHAAAEDGNASLSSPIENDATGPQAPVNQPPGPDLWGAEAENGWGWKAHHQIPIPEEFNEPAEGSQPEVRAEGSQPEVAEPVLAPEEPMPPKPLEQTAGADAAEVLAIAATLIPLAPPHGNISRVDRYEREHSAELLGNVPQQFFQDGRDRRRRPNEDGSAQFKATSFDRSPGRPPVVCWICQRKNRANSTTCKHCGSGLRDGVPPEVAQDQSYDMPSSSSDADVVNTQPAQQNKADSFPFDDDVRIRRRRVSTQPRGGDSNHSDHNGNSQSGQDGYGRGDDAGRHQHQPSRGGQSEGYHRNQNNDRSQYQGGGGGDNGQQRQASYQQHRSSSTDYGQGSEGQQRYQPNQQNQYRSGQQQYQGRQQYQSGQDRQRRQSNYQNNGQQQYQLQNSSRQQYQPRDGSSNRGYPSGRQEGGGGQQHNNQQPARLRRQMPPPVNL